MTPDQMQALLDYVKMYVEQQTMPYEDRWKKDGDTITLFDNMLEKFGMRETDTGDLQALPPYQCPRCNVTRAPWEKECLGCGDTASEAEAFAAEAEAAKVVWSAIQVSEHLWRIRDQAGRYYCHPFFPSLDARKARRYHTIAAANEQISKLHGVSPDR